MTDNINNRLIRFGFHTEYGGAHIARSMMMDELQALLDYVTDPDASKSEYTQAIIEANCLGKRSGQTRKISHRHLSYLYMLDPDVPIFRALRYFWQRDEKGRPLLALICAYARDAVLRLSAPFIINMERGIVITRENMEHYLAGVDSSRFSKATLRSTAQNVNTSWTRAGHLKGHIKKERVRAQATSGSVAFALFLSYIKGARGLSLFETEYAKLLDCQPEEAMALAEAASRKGWIVFKRVGDVMEVFFPKILSAQELERLHEQS